MDVHFNIDYTIIQMDIYVRYNNIDYLIKGIDSIDFCI